MKTSGIILSLLVASLAIPLGNSFAVISNPPTNLLAQSVSKTQINLSWNAPVNATQNMVSGYKIERDSGCIGVFSLRASNNTTTKYIDAGLAPGKCYAYRVYAINPSGQSAASNISQAVTFSGPSVNQTKSMDNLGQKVSDFVHKRNELLKKQREETLKLAQQCREKTNNATGTDRKQIRDNCQDLMKDIKVKYKDERDDIKKEFKTFKKDAKILLKKSRDEIKETKPTAPSIQNQTKQNSEQLEKENKMSKNPKKKS